MVREEPKYSIRVYDERVEIEGRLIIREAFDFLNFFDQQGFTTLESNYDNDTLTLSKRDEQKEERIRLIEESIEDNKHYQRLYNQAQDQIKKHEIRISQLDGLIRQIMMADKSKDETIFDLKNDLAKYRALLRLEQAYKEGKINEPTEYVDAGSDGEIQPTTGTEDSCRPEEECN